MSDDLVKRLRSGLDNCDRDGDGLELGGVLTTMNEAAARIEATEAALREALEALDLANYTIGLNIKHRRTAQETER